jgi:hypothetical protein
VTVPANLGLLTLLRNPYLDDFYACGSTLGFSENPFSWVNLLYEIYATTSKLLIGNVLKYEVQTHSSFSHQIFSTSFKIKASTCAEANGMCQRVPQQDGGYKPVLITYTLIITISNKRQLSNPKNMRWLNILKI